jgi:hypothetical protein
MINYIILEKEYKFDLRNFRNKNIFIYGFGIDNENYEEFIKGKMKLVVFDIIIEEVDILFLTKMNRVIKKSEILVLHHGYHGLFRRIGYIGNYTDCSKYELLLEFEKEINFPIKVYYFMNDRNQIFNAIDFPVIKYSKKIEMNDQIFKHILNNQVKGFLIENWEKIKNITIIINKYKINLNDIMIEIIYEKINNFLYIDTTNQNLNLLSYTENSTNIEIIINPVDNYVIYPIFIQKLINYNSNVMPNYIY